MVESLNRQKFNNLKHHPNKLQYILDVTNMFVLLFDSCKADIETTMQLLMKARESKKTSHMTLEKNLNTQSFNWKQKAYTAPVNTENVSIDINKISTQIKSITDEDNDLREKTDVNKGKDRVGGNANEINSLNCNDDETKEESDFNMNPVNDNWKSVTNFIHHLTEMLVDKPEIFTAFVSFLISCLLGYIDSAEENDDIEHVFILLNSNNNPIYIGNYAFTRQYIVSCVKDLLQKISQLDASTLALSYGGSNEIFEVLKRQVSLNVTDDFKSNQSYAEQIYWKKKKRLDFIMEAVRKKKNSWMGELILIF